MMQIQGKKSERVLQFYYSHSSLRTQHSMQRHMGKHLGWLGGRGRGKRLHCGVCRRKQVRQGEQALDRPI